ncbi:hypothetical protein H5410_033144 [Solanum commersonii]|uniref:AIG1-type G domain-containing protein n=1 Tax=Solanum commersonii TaxID=4109 RepID=A0A9J5YS83_SOLCO|nr:hypothetical protein H5410_033144 [Solanum commersonii]
MGGSAISDGWGIAPNEERTLVMIGRTGDGKSCTGNSILGRKAFRSMPRSAGVTSTCELQRTQLPNGPIINVIDTPGWFDFSIDLEIIGKEIVKCIGLAEDGIHAVLLVLSVRNDLEDHDVTLDAYLGADCPEPLNVEMILLMYVTQCSLTTRLRTQMKDLLFQVNLVGEKNGYTYNLFKELKEGAGTQKAKVDSSAGYSEEDIKELKDQMQRSHEEQIRRITAVQLEKEYAARHVAEQKAKKAHKKFKDENRKLKDLLERSRKETKEVRDRMLQNCNILEVKIWGMCTLAKFVLRLCLHSL